MRLTVGELEQTTTLSILIDEFISVKVAQGKSKRTLKDLEKELHKFYDFSSKDLDCGVLKKDLVKYFAQIPNTSSAVYNRPYWSL